METSPYGMADSSLRVPLDQMSVRNDPIATIDNKSPGPALVKDLGMKSANSKNKMLPTVDVPAKARVSRPSERTGRDKTIAITRSVSRARTKPTTMRETRVALPTTYREMRILVPIETARTNNGSIAVTISLTLIGRMLNENGCTV